MLIVLEGLDGAGKSTQISLMQSYFQKSGKDVKLLHFPRFDAPVYGDMIARFLRGELGAIDQVHPLVIALLFAGDRNDAAPMLRKWLDEGSVVILDRYVYSNIAFQCAKTKNESEEEMVREWILNTEFSVFSIPKPDLNIFLDVPIGFVNRKLNENRVGEEREYLKGKRDIHEADILFQQIVREIYLSQCGRDSSFIRLDCSDTDGEMLDSNSIFDMILSQIQKIG